MTGDGVVKNTTGGAATGVASVPSEKSGAETATDTQATDVKPNRNLLWLGIISTAVAVVAAGVSILIYHNSGDIYLDRSRPGFLPDEEEIEAEPKEKFSFPENGALTEDDLDEYLEHYQEALDDLDRLKSPYAADPLSNQALGLPEK